MKPDLLHAVEAAYRLEASDRVWLQGLTDAIGPLIDGGHGAYGYEVDASDPTRPKLGEILIWRGRREVIRALLAANAAGPPEAAETAYHGLPALCAATEVFGSDGWQTLCAPHAPSNVRDCVAVMATSPNGIGCVISAPSREVRRHPARTRRVWARVVAHVVAMQRLRGRRKGLRPEGEAVLSPGGRLEHAEGAAKSARALLREAALRRERARGRLRREDPEAAVELWRALVAGRWSIVDRFDRDGKRFLIAHENEPEGAGPRALTPRERQVVTRVAMGHPNKLVAYELGVSVGAVSAYLAGAVRKLGVSGRLDLARLIRASAP